MHRPSKGAIVERSCPLNMQSPCRGPIRVGVRVQAIRLVPVWFQAWVVRRQSVLRQHGSCCRLTGGVTRLHGGLWRCHVAGTRQSDRTATFTVTVPK